MTLIAEQLTVNAEVEPQVLREPTSLELVADLVEHGIRTEGIYTGELTHANDGLYISPDIASSGELPQVLEIGFLPGEFELGASDSHHEVVFGKAEVRTPDGNELIKIAIKAFTTESEKAGQEHDASLKARELGFEVFEPLALAKDGDTTFLVTRLREDVMSLDNVAWYVMPDQTERYETEVVPTLEFIATNLARLHANGIFHGDALAKNFVITDTGDFVAMDLEDAIIVTDEDDHIRLMNGDDYEEGKAYMDVTHFWFGLTTRIFGDTQNVFLENESVDVLMVEFEKRFLTPYINALQEQTTPAFYAQLDADRIYKQALTFVERH